MREAEAQRQDTQSQLEATRQELQRKDEALMEAEAKSQEASRRIEALLQELEMEKAKNENPPMGNAEFIYLCESGDTKQVEEAIMNGAKE